MKTKNESLKTLDLTKLNTVTGGAWNWGGTSSWNQSSSSSWNNWSAQSWSK